ncbi:MAG: transcriptional regulator, family [Acidobacteriaceae bacterium]|nr:transcriptional regulator, family [Acidobacteriaceae bacterium]
MKKNFNELRAKMSPAAQKRSAELAKRYREQMALDELRVARDLTQEHLAKLLGVKQSAISKMERRADMYVSTLQSMIKAMGGTLEITAVFPEGKVPISQFRKLKRVS